LQPKLIDINTVIDDTIHLLRRTLGKAVQIEFKGIESLTVMVDEAQLQSALVNIAINARDAMPDGGRLTFETKVAELSAKQVTSDQEFEPGRYALISVSDTGVGMSAEVLSRIFEPFFTTKPAGLGTGLGLSMVYGFTKQSGGHITAQSAIGKGTTFNLYLPCGESVVAGSIETQPTSSQRKSDGEVVLAVDDDAEIRATVVRQLKQLGYRVLEADSADAALKVLDDCKSIDLLFTDVVMPGGIDGRQLAMLARAKRPKLKVLLTSGFPATSGTGAHCECGADLLSKPYRTTDLAEAVRKVLAA
jgi:CheY-like chemotaxis protein